MVRIQIIEKDQEIEREKEKRHEFEQQTAMKQ